MKYIFLFIITITTLVSCKSGCNITEATALHDTLYVYNYERDSIYLHDSIYSEVYYSGDTVFMTKDRWHTAYRDRVKVDTLYRSISDTVTLQMPPVMVEKELSNMQQLYITLGTWTFYLLIAIAIIFIIRMF